MGLGDQGVGLVWFDTHHQASLPAGGHRHIASDQEGKAAEHPLLGDSGLRRDQLADPVCEILVVRHPKMIIYCPPTCVSMSTFVLLPGAGSGPDHWHLVVPLLRTAGHETVTPDLACESDTAGLPEYTAAAIEAIGDRDDPVIVGQSLGAFTAAAVAAARPVRLLVYVNAMIPARGESPGEWWEAVGHADAAAETLRRHGPMRDWTEADLEEVFLHDVPAEAAAGATPRKQGAGIFATPLADWPDGVAVRVISGRDDRLFPLAFQQRLARERLGVEPDVLPAGHAIALARPRALAEQLLDYVPPRSTEGGVSRRSKVEPSNQEV